jgi:nicotinate phosphoribosyltransferase
MLHTADFESIKRGDVTDVYFERTKEILTARGIDIRVRAEFMAKGLPKNWPWGVLAGIEEARSVLEGLDLNVRVLKEGTIFRTFEPVMEIEGRYLEFGHLETALLGLICQASGIATMAARCRQAAGDKTLLSFGARRMHPALAPMIERNAFIGGCDGVSVRMGAALVGQEPRGTMPHALILIMGDTLAATKAFDEIIDPKINRVSLIDTFQDEKFESIRVAEAMGDRLWGIRVDTPGSRRGDFKRLIEEIRWELERIGRGDVKIAISGGLDEKSIRHMAPVVDAFGVGTAISSAPVVDFSMDLVEADGMPRAKRGVRSGAKDLFRCSQCHNDAVVRFGLSPQPCPCGGGWEKLLVPLAETAENPEDIRSRVLDRLTYFPPEDLN